jgi:deazaflavin-dependent oxidoreductase (nitroreductase family)
VSAAEVSLDTSAFCHLTTTGRVTGRPHTIEIWFARSGSTLYFLSGARHGADWVRNIVGRPQVSVRVGAVELNGHGRILGEGDEDRLARHLVHGRYQPDYAGDLGEWRDYSLAVAVDLDAASI